MGCIVCSVDTAKERCGACHEVCMFVQRLTVPQRSEYVLVVDGSCNPTDKGHAAAGGGLVLAREDDESVIACCSVPFTAVSSDDAEFQTVYRAMLWAPLGIIWTDNQAAIRAFNGLDNGHRAIYIRPHMRDPLHNLAHRLANIARLREWDRLDRLWIPGEVWP